MGSFKEAMETIKEKYFVFEEFPLISRDRFPANCLKNAMDARENQVEEYAFRLKGRELEGLLLDLIPLTDTDQIKRAVKILCLRRSRRIVKLTGFLAQYYYDSPAVNILCKEMTSACKEGQVQEGGFLWKFGTEDNKIAAFGKAIAEEGQDMDAVCKKYGISEKSPMAMIGALTCFGKCDKNVFLINYKKMISLIEIFSAKSIFKMLSNYLKKLSLIEYNDSINTAISEKLGQPYVSAEWEPFSTALRDKFAQWSYLNRLKIHCEGQPEKFRIMGKYFEQVRSSYELNDQQAFITDFGWAVMTDVKGRKESYLYDKNLFVKEMNTWERENILPAFLSGKRETLTARQFMLSTDDAPCIKLSYEDISYYISELLDIKIGSEPDMRKNNLK